MYSNSTKNAADVYKTNDCGESSTTSDVEDDSLVEKLSDNSMEKGNVSSLDRENVIEYLTDDENTDAHSEMSELTTSSDEEEGCAITYAEGDVPLNNRGENKTAEIDINRRDLNHTENSTKPFLNSDLTPFFEIPVWNRNFSKKDYIINTIATSLRHKGSHTELLDYFQSFNRMIYNGNLPNCTLSLWRALGRDDSSVIKHTYCRSCYLYFGPEKETTTSNPIYCRYGEGVKHQFSHFLQISLKSQLVELFSLPNIAKLLEYGWRRPESNSIRDIFDGKEYRELCLPGKFLNNPHNFSLSFNIGCVTMDNSTKDAAWPIWVQLNELPPHSRHEHMMLAGLWVGSEKPFFTDFLLPFVMELRDLYENGITWRSDENEIIRSRFVSPLCTVDSIARYNIINMKQFTANGCTYCYHPGLSESRGKRIYPAMKTKLRTHEDMLLDGEKAFDTKTEIRGIRGPSVLMLLQDFKLNTGLVPKDLHAVNIGHGKHHTVRCILSRRGKWFIESEKYANEFKVKLSSLEDVYDEIDKILLTIKPPTRISQTLTSIRDMNLWEASEWKYWILYYSLPCLKNLLLPEYFNHYALFVNAISLLNSDSITESDLNQAEKQLFDYVQDMEKLWGRDSMTYELHLMTHLIDAVRNWGPLWAHSTASFESWNEDAIKTVTSPYGQDSQIVTRFLLRKILMSAVNDETVHEQIRQSICKTLNGAKSFSDEFKCIERS